MTLCFVDPADAIRAIADSVGREARRQLLGEVVRAWVDEIPDTELQDHYAKAIAELDEHDISMLAAWHGSMEVGQPVPNRDFLMGAFDSLGEHRREALKLAAGFRGEEAFEEGISEERALDMVLEWLSHPRLLELMAGRGANPRRITARLAGGASMFAALAPPGTIQMGERNVVASKQVLHIHAIPLVGEAVGGDFGRTVRFDVSQGTLEVRSVAHGVHTI